MGLSLLEGQIIISYMISFSLMYSVTASVSNASPGTKAFICIQIYLEEYLLISQ